MRVSANWLEGLSVSDSLDVYRTLAHMHAVKGGQRGKLLARLIHDGDLESLCELEHDWATYEKLGYSPYQVYNLVQAQAFFTKNRILDLGRDQEAVAWDTFLAAEGQCRETNGLLKDVRENRCCFADRRVNGWLFEASQLISRVLGPLPSLSELGFRFGKGATTLTRKIEASIREKLNQSHAACSEELLPLAGEVFWELPSLAFAWARMASDDGDELWFVIDVQIMDGVINFVLKNYKTHRVVVTEPPLNQLVQLAYGDYITKRLLRFGVDLRDQERNQRLALKGSKDGKLATIDLKSASDTIAYELAFETLPLDWATSLSRARTGHVRYKGGRLKQEKFSSMGNGFTFPLETLLFWSLTCAVCETRDPERVSVYGDDIICPADRYGDVVTALRAVGFTPNESKSYSTGPFRESCGKDYFQGIDIRPYFAKGRVSGFSLFKLHNFYVRRNEPDMALEVLRYLPHDLYRFGPDGMGDGHLVARNFYEAPELFQSLEAIEKTHKLRSVKGYEGCVFDTFSITTRSDAGPLGRGDEVLPLYCAEMYTSEKVLDMRQYLRDVLGKARARNDSGIPSVDQLKFIGHMIRGHSRVSNIEKIPEVLRDDGQRVKAVSLPSPGDLDTDDVGEMDYRTQSIYVLKQ